MTIGTVVITIVEVGGVTTIVEVGVMTIVVVVVMITVAVDVTMTATVTGTTGGMMIGGRGDFSFLFWWLRELNRDPGSTGTMTETVTGITIGVMTAGTDVLDVLQNALCCTSPQIKTICWPSWLFSVFLCFQRFALSLCILFLE